MKLHRADGVLDLKMLHRKKVVFYGMGSLGSMAAEALAYPWQEIVFVDPEVLGIENVERHVLGKSAVGKPKVLGMKAWCVDRGVDPGIITTVQGLAQQTFNTNTDADVVIVTIDHQPSKGDINQWAMKHNIPTIYGGVYPKGKGGDVIVVPTPKDVCWYCAAELLGENAYQGRKVGDYGIDGSDLLDASGTVTAVPAIRWTVDKISCIIADLALQILEGENVKPQIVVSTNEWEDILLFGRKSIPPFLAPFLAGVGKLGLLPTLRLRHKKSGLYALQLKRGELVLALDRWADCPCHNQTLVSPDF